MSILILLTLSFHLTNIAAIACDEYNITYSQQNDNDNLTIHFSSNDLLKLDRQVRCKSTSSLESVNGCAHYCIGLGYGQHDTASIEIENNNDLQPPSLAFLNIIDNKVRLGIRRPMDSFDYVNVQCSNNESHIIFNTSMPLNNSLVTVNCSFLTNTSLMSFVLETIKEGFDRQVNHISREIPLPISFRYFLNSRVLTVIADPPPSMKLNSTYEFQLIFYDGNNENISYERAKISNLRSDLGETFIYSIIPNLQHKIIFKHIVDSIGYAQSNATIPPISNTPYPFAATNLRVREEFNKINLTWIDTHDLLDPIEYIVLCNSSDNSMRNVGRNTTYLCENMLFNETNTMSVQTRVTIPGYPHDQDHIAVAQINVEQIPEIPLFKDFDKTENSITIRWNFDNNSLITNLFVYGIKCGLNQNSIPIDIQSNEYKCQSLVEGTLYVITMFVVNIDNTIQRSISINSNTLLKECQYKTHFYSPDLNGTRSVIIEWNPPEKNFDKINVFCPSSYMTYEYFQIVPIMLVKCIVTSGTQYNVTFETFKSGFVGRTVQFTDRAPMDITTTTTTTTTTTATPTTPTTTTTTTTTATPTTTTTTATPTTTTTTATTTTTTTTTISPTTTTTATISPAMTTTTTISPATTTTARISPGTTTTSKISPITTTTITTSTSPEISTSVTASNCSPDVISKIQVELSRWRTAAIVAFIVAGFLVLATICLTILIISPNSSQQVLVFDADLVIGHALQFEIRDEKNTYLYPMDISEVKCFLQGANNHGLTWSRYNADVLSDGTYAANTGGYQTLKTDIQTICQNEKFKRQLLRVLRKMYEDEE